MTYAPIKPATYYPASLLAFRDSKQIPSGRDAWIACETAEPGALVLRAFLFYWEARKFQEIAAPRGIVRLGRSYRAGFLAH